MKLKDRVAIITGAANGIGLACSQLFARQGAHVIMADVDFKKCEQEAQKISAEPFLCDVRSGADIKLLITQTVEKYKKIDVLVNNVAVAIAGNITEMPESEWNQVINTNLNSAYRCIKEVLPYMLKQNKGSVINLSSTQAHRSWHNWTAYAAAKGGLLSMTTQLAGQFAPFNVRFNTISPGTITTPMLEERIKKEGKGLLANSLQMHAMERFGTPEEVAAVAFFLASDDSSFVTGVDIKVDGGLSTLPRYQEL